MRSTQKNISQCHRHKKQNIIEQTQLKRQSKLQGLDIYNCISKFKSKIRQGPCHICSVCNQLLYRVSVILLKKRGKYIHVPPTVFTGIRSFDKNEYICKTCNSKLLKGKIPCQAVYNNMIVDTVPTELESLEKLEQILIAQRIVFEKVIIMPKGQQQKIKGAICNVPVECDDTCKILTRPPEQSGIIMLKLKCKLQLRGHVYFRAVCPQFVFNAHNWLKLNNPLYNDIVIDVENINP